MGIKKILASWSFRRKLLLFLVVIFLPAFGVMIASGFSQRQKSIMKAEDDALLLARSLAAQQEQIAIATKTMLSTLAQLPAVQHLDIAACNQLFRELQEKYPFYTVIAASRPDGNIVAASAAFDPGVNLSDRKHFKEAISSLDFAVGEYQVGRVSKTTSLNYAFPVQDAHKQVVAVLTAGFNLNEFGRFISEANLPEGSAVAFTDHKGVRLFRSPQNEATSVGKLTLKGFFEPISGRREEGLHEWTALDGVKRIYAFKQLRLQASSPPYLYIAVGQPKDLIIHQANQDMLGYLSILGLAAVLSLSLAWILANVVIIKPINRLVAATQEFSTGEMETRTGLPYTPDELGRLAQSFDDMASRLEMKHREREQAEQALSRANAELEGRVQKRTAELSASKEALLIEVEEHQRTEETLRQISERLQTVINASPLAICVLNLEGRVQMWNRASERLFGWQEAEVLGRVLPIVPEEKLEEFQGSLQRLLQGESLSGAEVIGRKKDGSPIDISIYTASLYDDQGQVTGIMSLLADITGRKQMEEHLRNEQIFSEMVTESLPGIFYFFDEQGRFLQWNDNLEKVAGYSAGEIASMRPQEFFEGEDRRVIEAAIREAFLQGEVTAEAALTTKDGRRIPHFFTGRLILLDGKPCLLGMGVDISQRLQAEKTVQEQLAFRQILMDALPLPIFYKDTKGIYLGCNRAFEEFFGWSKADILGKSVYDLAPKEIADKYHQKDRELFESPGLQTYEFFTKDRAGNLRDVIFTKAIFTGPDGEVGGLIGSFLDITERKRTENISKLNELRLEALEKLNQMADAPLQEITSFALEEAIRLTGSTIGYLAFMNEDETVLTMHSWSKTALAECRTVDRPLLYPVEGTGLWGEAVRRRQAVITNDYAAPNPWKKGVPEGHLPVLRHMNAPIFDGKKIVIVAGVGNKPSDYDESDVRQLTLLMEGMWRIIQRNRAEEALRDSEQFLAEIFNNIQDGLCVLDPDFNIIQVNSAMEKFPFTPPLVGRKCYEAYHGRTEPCEVCPSRQVLLTGQPADKVFAAAADDGSLVVVEIQAFPLLNHATGQVKAVIEYVRNVTERQRVEEERLKLSKLESLGLLAGGIAHDFNNILTAILGNISLAMMDGPGVDRRQERLGRAEKACLRAQALSRQLLTFAKGGAPVKELISVAETIAESAEFACRGSQVRCESDFPEDLWSLEVDPGQIIQVFQNLIINAIQAMPTGGTIKIQGENLSLGEPNDLSLQKGNYVKITIQDQGLGIPAEYIPKIFDPYFTTKQRGSGLGLATSYSIIKNHHGHILVESKLGEGTRFQIYLPASSQKSVQPPAEERTMLAGKGQILVMDDEEMVREVLGTMLLNLGYKVTLARDGAEAVKIFSEARGNGGEFAAVILDLTVPGGMGGKDSLDQLRQIDPQIKAIVSSGYSDDPIMADFRKYGFNGVIAKPYKVADLSKALQEVVLKEMPVH